MSDADMTRLDKYIDFVRLASRFLQYSLFKCSYVTKLSQQFSVAAMSEDDDLGPHPLCLGI